VVSRTVVHMDSGHQCKGAFTLTDCPSHCLCTLRLKNRPSSPFLYFD